MRPATIPAPLRAELLDMNGIGPETGGDIPPYALDRPAFVVGAVLHS